MARSQEVDGCGNPLDSRQKAMGDMLTHVDSIVELVVDDLEEPDDVTVTTFLHDSNFLAYLLFEATKLVR